MISGAALADYIAWEAVNADTARATITSGGIAVPMMFRFDADGRLIESTAVRHNDSGGRNESWVNRNDSDQEFGPPSEQPGE